MNVLITGGAGYLGSVLTGRLLEAGHSVTVLDNLAFGQKSLFGFCHHQRFDFRYGDVRDDRLLQELVPRHDAFIPLAALVGAKLCDRHPDEARSVNVEAVASLNRLRSSTQLVVYPNTNSGYGSKTGQKHCTEETPLEPITLYGQTKCAAERLLLESPLAVTLRLATVFGMSPRMRLDLLVNQFVYAAVTDRYLVLFEKDFQRNYVHIQDVAEAFLYCLENGARLAGRPYNLGQDDANLSKAELAEKVKEHVPELYIHYAEIGSDPDKRDYIVSSARLREAGFCAKRSLDDGIAELLKGYRMLVNGPFANV